jgi:hypothetical protein
MLATDADKFDKGMLFDKISPLLGNGLATSNGDFYRRRCRSCSRRSTAVTSPVTPTP